MCQAGPRDTVLIKGAPPYTVSFFLDIELHTIKNKSTRLSHVARIRSLRGMCPWVCVGDLLDFVLELQRG